MKYFEIGYDEACARYLVGDLTVAVYRGVYANDYIKDVPLTPKGDLLSNALKNIVEGLDDNCHYSFRFYRVID
jgi:hypothetical protein